MCVYVRMRVGVGVGVCMRVCVFTSYVVVSYYSTLPGLM